MYMNVFFVMANHTRFTITHKRLLAYRCPTNTTFGRTRTST